MTLFCLGNVPSSKNGRRWTGKYFIPSKATIKWRKDTKWWWEKNKDIFKKAINNKEKPLKIGFHFVRGTRHKYDWVNPLQTIQDEMVEMGWIDDDNVDEIIPFPFKHNKKYTSYNKEKPGFYIKIY